MIKMVMLSLLLSPSVFGMDFDPEKVEVFRNVELTSSDSTGRQFLLVPDESRGVMFQEIPSDVEKQKHEDLQTKKITRLKEEIKNLNRLIQDSTFTRKEDAKAISRLEFDLLCREKAYHMQRVFFIKYGIATLVLINAVWAAWLYY